MKSGEEIILLFSVKKCMKGQIYQITLESDNKSLGLQKKFETELRLCKIENEELIFRKKLPFIFKFGERQKLKIIFSKRIIIDDKKNYKLKCNTKETEISSLITSPNSTYERYFNEKIKSNDIFCIKVNKTENENKINICDFIKCGIKLNTFLAFDFSDGLNKQPREKSLDNYLKIISNLIRKIFFYSKGQSLYLYGFGAKFNNQCEDLFNLSGGEDIPISLSNVLKVFTQKQKYIIPKKNLVLSKLIRKMTKIIYKLYEMRIYNVLYIFEREIPDYKDKQELIDAFIEASYLPLTIIIIGEGKNEFNKLKELFTERINEASSGMLKNRNNILFMDFYENFNEDEEKLTQWCLEELSKQIIGFYELINISPLQIYKDNMKAIEQSFMQYNKVSICIYQSYIKNSNNLMSNIYESKINNNFFKKQSKQLKEEIPQKNEFINLNSKAENEVKDKIIDKNNNINANKKFTPGGSINHNLNIDNPYKAQNNPNNNQKDEAPEESKEEKELRKYKITPGNSIWKINKDNPYSSKKEEEKEEKKENEKYKITPGESILKISPNNPYNISDKKEEKDSPDLNKKLLLIPQHSTCLNIMANPYASEKDKNTKTQNNESKIDSYNISTEESAQVSNNINTKASNMFRFNANYSVDN